MFKLLDNKDLNTQILIDIGIALEKFTVVNT